MKMNKITKEREKLRWRQKKSNEHTRRELRWKIINGFDFFWNWFVLNHDETIDRDRCDHPELVKFVRKTICETFAYLKISIEMQSPGKISWKDFMFKLNSSKLIRLETVFGVCKSKRQHWTGLEWTGLETQKTKAFEVDRKVIKVWELSPENWPRSDLRATLPLQLRSIAFMFPSCSDNLF